MKGKISQTPVVLANVYAPNFDNAHFAQDLLSKFPALNAHLLIFGGDLNCVIDPDLDKSSIVMKASCQIFFLSLWFRMVILTHGDT